MIWKLFVRVVEDRKGTYRQTVVDGLNYFNKVLSIKINDNITSKYVNP